MLKSSQLYLSSGLLKKDAIKRATTENLSNQSNLKLFGSLYFLYNACKYFKQNIKNAVSSLLHSTAFVKTRFVKSLTVVVGSNPCVITL